MLLFCFSFRVQADTALDNTAAVGKLREAISQSLQDCILALNTHTNNATPRMAQLLLILPLLRLVRAQPSLSYFSSLKLRPTTFNAYRTAYRTVVTTTNSIINKKRSKLVTAGDRTHVPYASSGHKAHTHVRSHLFPLRSLSVRSSSETRERISSSRAQDLLSSM